MTESTGRLFEAVTKFDIDSTGMHSSVRTLRFQVLVLRLLYGVIERLDGILDAAEWSVRN